MRLSKLHDRLPGWVGSRSFQARWAIGSRWRRARGQHGAFARAEVSARAAQLTDLWERRWHRVEPLGYLLRVEYADQWVRFHSLPESQRYAESATERDEILRRHRTVLRELHGSPDTAALWVVAADWDWKDLAGGWSRGLVAGAWPWRTGHEDDDDPGAGLHYFWAASGLSGGEVDSLLLAAADDRARFLIGAPDLGWLYCPYDGGADVLLPDRVERDVLKDRHADWLPSHPGGL